MVGDSICFDIEASCIAVQYKKTILQPAPVARLLLDGDEENAVILDANFSEAWGDCLYLQPILIHGKRQRHNIRIEIMESGSIDSEFYLVSLICS